MCSSMCLSVFVSLNVCLYCTVYSSGTSHWPFVIRQTMGHLQWPLLVSCDHWISDLCPKWPMTQFIELTMNPPVNFISVSTIWRPSDPHNNKTAPTHWWYAIHNDMSTGHKSWSYLLTHLTYDPLSAVIHSLFICVSTCLSVCLSVCTFNNASVMCVWSNNESTYSYDTKWDVAFLIHFNIHKWDEHNQFLLYSSSAYETSYIEMTR